MITDIQAQHYLFELLRESELVDRLFRRFQAAADTWLAVEHQVEPDGNTLWHGTEAEREMQETIEGVLSGFARISLFLFPEPSTGSFGKQRGQRLRELLSIGADHPIGNRDLRNHWMHLDHRFDAYVQAHGSAPVGYFLEIEHRLTVTAKSEMLRLVDPAGERVFVIGKEYSLRALSDAAEHIGQQAALTLLDLNRSDASEV